MEIHEHGVNIHKLIVNGICEVTVNSHNSGSEFWNVTGWYTRCQIILDNYIIYYNRTPAFKITQSGHVGKNAGVLFQPHPTDCHT